MTDQQPEVPAAREPENPTPTRIDGTPPAPEPTRIDGTPEPASRDGAEDTRTVPTAGAADGTRRDEPARWSGSAAVPPHVPRPAWWARRRAQPGPGPAAPPADPWADSEDWSATPAVDPWADQDTPWQTELPFPEAMPPTRTENALPPTRMDSALPPTRTEPPLPPARREAPLPPTRMDQALPAGSAAPQPARTEPALSTAKAGELLRRARAQLPGRTATPPAAPPAPAAPPPVAPPSRRRWGRKESPQPATANRIPVQARPPAPAPGRPVRIPTGRPVSSPEALPEQGRRPPAPPRRRRRWPRRLFMFTLFTAVCCCGVPAYLAWPAARQYPVSAALPGTVADLDLREDGASRRALDQLSEQLGGDSLIQGDVFAGIYADGSGKRVTVYGTTGLRFTPESDVEAEIGRLTGQYALTDVQSHDLGETGLHERCGVGRADGRAVVVCAWADHGSIATVLLTRRSVTESAELTGVLRNAVLTSG